MLGAGHAGKLALAAARDAVAGGPSSPSTSTPTRSPTSSTPGLCDVGVVADLRDPLATLAGARRRRRRPAADLTVVVVSASRLRAGRDPAHRQPGGTVLFFSMATRFQTAALTADGMSSRLTMLIGNGYARGRRRLRARPVPRVGRGLREAIGGRGTVAAR